jgi:hypothetical protein
VNLSHAGPADTGNCTTGTGGSFGTFGGPHGKPNSVDIGTTGACLQPSDPVQDPLAFVNRPAVPAAHAATTVIHNGTRGCTCTDCNEYKPGVYVGGLSLNGHEHAVFDPGV